jgi:hypothetical protein
LLRPIEICDWQFTIYESTGYLTRQFDVVKRLGLRQSSAALAYAERESKRQKAGALQNLAAVY